MLESHKEGEPHKMVLPSGEAIRVPTRHLSFEPWSGPPISDTYGGKAVLDLNGEPLFPELAILRLLQREGFDGVWVDTYSHRFRQSMAPEGCKLPPWVQAEFEKIVGEVGNWSGCWDVLAWKADQIFFVESKRKGKDSVRSSQERWLLAALRAGNSADCFLICEWDFRADHDLKSV